MFSNIIRIFLNFYEHCSVINLSNFIGRHYTFQICTNRYTKKPGHRVTIALLLMDSKCLNQQNDNERCEKHMNENGEGRVRKKLETIITKAAQQGKKFKRA